MCYAGVSRVMDLLDANIPLSGIADRYGRPVHPAAREFLSHHVQAKRMLIKNAVHDMSLRSWCRCREQRQAAACIMYIDC